jgi:Uma2 family endonuclease
MTVETRMTAAEFLALPETNRPTELIDGELYRMASPTPTHQDAVFNAATLIKQLTKAKGGRTFIAPLDVYFDELNVPQPDVMWVAPDSPNCVILEKHLRGAPDLIVEVLSPGSVKNDRKIKFRLYEKHGVREYWMVDLSEQLIEVWQLQSGKFMLLDVYGVGEKFVSPLLGEVEVKAIFPD